MPVYEVELSDGRVVDVESDKEPTIDALLPKLKEWEASQKLPQVPAAMLSPGKSIVSPQREPDVQPVGEMLTPTPNDVPLINIPPESLRLAFPQIGLARGAATLLGPTAEKVERGLEKGTAESISGFTSPESLAMLPAFTIPYVGQGLALGMGAKGLGQSAGAAAAALERGDYEEAARQVPGAVIAASMLRGGGEALRGEPSTTGEQFNAIQKPETGEIFSPVQTRSGEGAVEVPAEESASGVRERGTEETPLTAGDRVQMTDASGKTREGIISAVPPKRLFPTVTVKMDDGSLASVPIEQVTKLPAPTEPESAATPIVPPTVQIHTGTQQQKEPEILPTEQPALAPEQEVNGPGTGVGPGGTTETDVGTKAELAQLTDSISTLAKDQPATPSKAFTIGERMAALKDGISDTLTGLKSAAGYLKERLIGKPQWTTFKAMLGDRHLSLSESAINARRWVAKSEKAVRDPVLREAISNWIDAGGDEALLRKAAAETKPQYRAGYERALKLTPEEKLVAENVKNYFSARLDDAIDAGILNEGIEDYIHRMYERESPWKNGVLAELRSGIYTGKPALAKQRVFQYDFEAEKAGYKPIKSFIKRVAAYDMSLNKAIADRQAVKAMHEIIMPDGRPMIDVGGIGVTVPKEGATEATLIKPGWKPTDADTPIKNRSDFKAYDYPALQKWKWVGADAEGNPILLQGDVLVHPDAIGQVKTLFEKSKIRQNPVGRAALGVGSTIKQTMLDLSGFHLTQITVHGWEHRTFKPVGEIDFENPDVRGLIRGGLVVGDTHGYELFSEGLAGSSLTRHIPKLGPKLQAANEWLFNEYIPRLKVATGLHALERNKARFPKLSEDQVNHLTANQMNAAFGELNYEMLGRSKTTQDILRLALLAPDFLEARSRFAGQAMTKFGKEQFQALALGAVALYVTARIVNKLLNDEWHFEPKNAFSIVHNGRAYSLRTVQGDLLHLMTDPGRFFFNRLNPVYGRTAIEAATGRDYFGRKRDLLQQLKDFASVPIPISFRGLLNPSEQKLWESFLNAFGITERRASSAEEVYKAAESFKKEHKIRTDPGEFIYDPEKDPFRLVRQTALYGDSKDTAKAIADTVKKGEVTKTQIVKHFQNYANHPFTGSRANEAKFKASLTADQRKIYEDALKERRKVLNNVKDGAVKR